MPADPAFTCATAPCSGSHSLETICLLLALKIEHPKQVHLIRGNHEAHDINALFGFRLECLERLGDDQVRGRWLG